MQSTENITACAGESLPNDAIVANRNTVIEILREIYDPEIPVNIYDLGLIYDLDIRSDGTVYINMSLTAPMCPVAGEFPFWVANAVADIDGIGKVNVNLVWDPPWNVGRMSGDAKLALGIE